MTAYAVPTTVYNVHETAYIVNGREAEATMKAIVQDKYGSAEVLEARDIEKPAIGDNEVLVRVHAASVHVGDWILMTGSPFVMRMATGLRKPKNPVPGSDVAGTVEAVGKDVHDASTGGRGLRLVRGRVRRVRVSERGPLRA